MLFLKEDKKGLVWGFVGAPAFYVLILFIVIFGVLIIVTNRQVVTITSLEEDTNYRYIVDFLLSKIDIENEDVDIVDFMEKWNNNKDKYDIRIVAEIKKFLENIPDKRFANLKIFYEDKEVFEMILKDDYFEKEKVSFEVPLSDGKILDLIFYRYGGWLGE